MKSFSTLLPIFVFFATTCSALRRFDEPYHAPVSPPSPDQSLDSPLTPHAVSWNQTEDKPLSQLKGGLGSSVQGYFPYMSKERIGMGCGLNWADGQLHAGFDGGDPNNGVGGGFTWTPTSLSSIVGVHFADTKINLNLTVTTRNEVLFTVNGDKVDWSKVMQLAGQEGPGGSKMVKRPVGNLVIGQPDAKAKRVANDDNDGPQIGCWSHSNLPGSGC